jgi:hypothetical protein
VVVAAFETFVPYGPARGHEGRKTNGRRKGFDVDGFYDSANVTFW